MASDPNIAHADVDEIFEALENGELSVSSCAALDLGQIRNSNGESVLLTAARTGQVEIVREFINDFDLEDTDSDGWTALLDAAHCGSDEIVKILLDAGASVDNPDLMGWTPLMWAVYKNRLKCAELLIQRKAHVNLIDEEDNLTPLILAAARGFTAMVDLLLKSGAEVNTSDKFGSTALIWAARKGYKQVVELLLAAGAELDAVGMYSATALTLATRGNFADVVELLLTREPNVNTTDQNGLSPLGVAAREGYFEIASMLIQQGAYVNSTDRFGNSILASAVRSGNANIVKMLLEKHADVNSKDDENRTAVHLAVDKGFMDIALVLIEKKPNLELKNKDGDTPLLRAVKNRHVGFCQLLVNAGAKISATDNAGDNALHIALRARSKRITQCLLKNPSDSRLLYRPNKSGQTPYSIDQESSQPIIPLIFGPLDAEVQMDAMLGYDVYSNVLADIACEPSLVLPLTIGLYAKWGSGKSLLLEKLKNSMRSFSRSWLDGVQLSWSWSLVFSLAFFVALITLVCITAVATLSNMFYVIAVGIGGLVLFISLIIVYGIIYYGSEVKVWSSSVTIARQIARTLAHMRLFLSVALLHAPAEREKDYVSSPVSFLFADYHRLSSIGGEQALAKIVVNLFEAAESHYGSLAVRIFCALSKSYARGTESKSRRQCGVPVSLLAILCLSALITALILLTIWLYNAAALSLSIFYSSMAFFAVAAILALYPAYLITVHTFVSIPKIRINKAARQIEKTRFEGFMHKLQKEVDLLATMVHSLDAFTSSLTRLVVFVDGLDNCEQERMVQTLDALELLFANRPNRPFIVTIAVDPHIIISAVNHSMHSALTGTELTGYDYLKNIVNMPFYLHNSAIKQLQSNLRDKRESLAEWKERFKRQDTFHGSYLSLKEGSDGRSSRKMTVIWGTRGLSHSLLADDYFSNMNPRAMKRIISALTLTGRLMRAFEIEFSWVTLGNWVSLIEQWPSRMCWLIDQTLDIPNDSFPLAQLYSQLKQYIPKKDSLIELDRNPDNFEAFLEQASSPGPDQLTVGHVRRFVPCTSNLDPYLRKLIREHRLSSGQHSKLVSTQNAPTRLSTVPVSGPAQYLFKDPGTWSTIESPLVEMKLEAIVELIKKLDISQDRAEEIVGKIRVANLSGLVLCTCDLKDVQEALSLSLGDWTMVKLLVETLRTWEPIEVRVDPLHSPSGYQPAAVQTSGSLSSIQERARRLVAQSSMQAEVESEHQWLLESLSGMDAAETEGDVPTGTSTAPSVHFEDGAASDGDSTESMCGSQENLLDSSSTSHRPTRLSRLMTRKAACDRAMLAHRREEMGRMRMDSIHSDTTRELQRRSISQSRPFMEENSDNQDTVKELASEQRRSLRDVFSKSFSDKP